MADCTIIDKLNYILETKDLIKTALETQDVEVLESDTFRKYSEYITEIRKVASVNGETGDIVLKTINGQNLVGEGNIVIQGGEGGTAGVNKIIMGDADYGWNAYQGDVRLTNTWMDLDDDGMPETYDIRIGSDAGSSLWFGFNSTDNSIKIEDNGSRLSFTVNPDILGGGGGSVTETDPVFTEWKNNETIVAGNGATYDTDGASEEEIHPSIVIGKDASVWADGIAIGENAYSEMGAVTIGKNVTSYGIVSIGSDNEGSGIAIGKNNKGNGISVGENINNSGIAIGKNITENYGGIVIGENISNSTDNGIAIGWNAKINTKNPENTDNGEGIAIGLDAIAYDKDDVAIGSNVSTDDTYTTNINNVLKGDNSNNAYIKDSNGNYTKILDLINNAGGDVDLSGYATEQWVEDKGYLTEHQQLKTINGESIIGEGNITIEGGGSSSGVESIDTGGIYFKGKLSFSSSEESSDNSWRVGLNGDMYDSTTDEYYGNGGSLIFGVKSSDNSIIVKDGGSLADLTINPDILSGGTSSDNTYTAGDGISITDNTITNTGVTAINIGRDIQDWTQKNGVVSFYSDWYDGSYDVAIGGTSFFGIKPIDNSIILEHAGGTVNGNSRCGIKINTDNFKTINGESIIGEGNITIEGGSGTINIIELTQAEYDALTEYADNTFYVITDATETKIPTLQEGWQGNENNYVYSDYTDKNHSVVSRASIGYAYYDDGIEIDVSNTLWGGMSTSESIKIAPVSEEQMGFMTPSDKIKLDSLNGGITEETDPVFTEWKDKTIQVIIGSGATGSDNTQFDNISIGRGARGGNRTIAIGGYSYIDSKFSTSLGTNTKSSADATYSVIIGYSASGNSENSVAIGAKAKVESGVTNGCAIGANTESNATFNTNINNVLKGDTSNYAYILDADGNYVKIIDTYYTKTEIDNLIGGVSDKISDINSMI